jgi:hypothetical protein
MKNLNITDSLIKAGAHLNIQDKYGLTPLHNGNSLILLNFKKFLKFYLSCYDEQS